ncbi:hypothetical protein Barb4_02475 [Bacteroidales bacterium Barb4]|nr:hypothetical protein Barb4_02475 [Bacteroidales bacterium Barb4]
MPAECPLNNEITDVSQMPRKGKRFQPHMQRSGIWGLNKALKG